MSAAPIRIVFALLVAVALCFAPMSQCGASMTLASPLSPCCPGSAADENAAPGCVCFDKPAVPNVQVNPDFGMLAFGPRDTASTAITIGALEPPRFVFPDFSPPDRFVSNHQFRI